MTRPEYISRENYLSQGAPKSIWDSDDKNQTTWYRNVIQDSAGNKLRLIGEDLELAHRMFARYEDAEGFELIIANPTSDEEVKRNARMQLESLLNVKRVPETGETKGPFGGKCPLSLLEIPEREDVSHRGRSPVRADIVYHQADSIEQPSE